MSRQLFQQNERDTIQTKNHCLVQLLLKKVLHQSVTPTFTKVKGQFLNENVK